MKKFKFLDMVRRSRMEDKFSVSGPLSRNMPWCQRCQKAVDAASLEHSGPDSIEIKVRCHGSEDACRIDFPHRLRDWESDPDAGWAIKRAMADYVAFERSHTDG